MPTKRLLSVQEAAQELGVGKSRIRQFIYEGRLGAERIGEFWAIHEDEVARFKRIPRKGGKPKEETPDA